MKRIIIVFIYLAGFLSSLFSQGKLDTILAAIELNNSTLIALRNQVNAQKIGNRTGIAPQNPEVEFNYLWGNPEIIGKRSDIKVIQTFDFPTSYGFRNQIAEARNDQAELVYQKQLRSILLQARLFCIDLEYAIELGKEYEYRVKNAGMIASSYKAKYEKGETGIIEFNKAQLNKLNVQHEAEKIYIEKRSILAELITLNGGIPMEFNGINSIRKAVPAEFDEWYEIGEQINPSLVWLRKEAEIGLLSERLAIATGMPKISTGYMSEKVVGEHFQGIIAGISIPLWENRNKVKYAKANSIAMESAAADSKIIFYNQLKARHERAVNLQNLVNSYRTSLRTFDNTFLLEKALNKGEISLTSYFFEISINYEGINKLLKTEWELDYALAILNQYLQ